MLVSVGTKNESAILLSGRILLSSTFLSRVDTSWRTLCCRDISTDSLPRFRLTAGLGLKDPLSLLVASSQRPWTATWYRSPSPDLEEISRGVRREKSAKSGTGPDGLKYVSGDELNSRLERSSVHCVMPRFFGFSFRPDNCRFAQRRVAWIASLGLLSAQIDDDTEEMEEDLEDRVDTSETIDSGDDADDDDRARDDRRVRDGWVSYPLDLVCCDCGSH